MSYANGTTHYNLPQTVGTDKRDWFDTNEAFAEIDEALFGAVQAGANLSAQVTALTGRLTTAEGNIQAVEETVAEHGIKISTLEGTVGNHTNQIADVRQDTEDMICAYNEGSAQTSTHAYVIGDYFIYNDVLYRATAIISVGDTIVPNTNCKATNVSTELDEINTSIVPLPPITVIGNGVKTYEAVLNEIYAQIDKSKIRATSNLVIKSNAATSFLIVGAFTDSLISTQGSANNNAINYATLKASGSTYFQTIVGNTQSTNEYSNVPLGAGESMTFNY